LAGSFLHFHIQMNCLLSAVYQLSAGPPDLPRVVLLFKVFLTLGFTESEHLVIIVDEHHAMVGVDGP
jgi:hypothetical protein